MQLQPMPLQLKLSTMRFLFFDSRQHTMASTQSRLWQLDSGPTSVVLHASTADAIPAIAWIGKRLSEKLSFDSVAALTDLPLPMAKLDDTVPQTVFPQSATGTESSAALRGHRDGAFFAHRFICTKVEQRQHTLTIHLSDNAAQLGVTMQMELQDKSGVLSISTTLTNRGTSAYQIDWLASASVPLAGEYSECLYLHGRWGYEFQQQRQQITAGHLLLENTRGRTSHELYPGIVTGEAGFSEQHGRVLAAQLAWSGSHRTLVERLGDGRLGMQSGIALDSGELRLAPDEQFTTPTMHLVTANGLNQASQAMHSFARQEILPKWSRTTRPIHTNSWEALYFDHDIEKLFELIDSAAALGAERFVLDDGWFPARRSDNAGLGDWTVDRSVYPDGLHPIVEHTRQAGLQFGLWFEPEMVNPDSNLYREHPEWALHLSPYETPLARYQLVLNLDLPEVQEYLYSQISVLVKEYDIDYIKWDFNRDLLLAGDGNSGKMHKQAPGCYRLMDRLNKAFPKLEIESCASGGARADWGILKYTGRVWTSDSIDAIDRATIQRGYSIFNPPEIMGAHIGHEEAHLTGRSIDIHTRAIVALQGQLGFEIDARHISDDEAATLRHYVDLYKQHRHWISESLSYRLDSNSDELCCCGLISADQSQSLWFAVATGSISKTAPGKLLPVGLANNQSYTVKLASGNIDHFTKFSKHVPRWLTDGALATGETLMNIGLTLPIMPAQSALLLEITAQ